MDPDLAREGWAEVESARRARCRLDGLRTARSKVCALETVWYLRNQLLRDSDWAGMAHSLEIRTPLVDTFFFRRIAPMLASPSPPGKSDLAGDGSHAAAGPRAEPAEDRVRRADSRVASDPRAGADDAGPARLGPAHRGRLLRVRVTCPPARRRARAVAAPGPPRRAGRLSRGLRRHGRSVAAVVVGRCLTVAGSMAGVRLLTEHLTPETFGRYKLALAGVSLIAGIAVRPFLQYAMRAYHDAAARGGLHRFLRRFGRSFGAYAAVLGLVVAVAGRVLIRDGGRLGPAAPALIGAVLALQALVERDRALSITRGRQGAAESVGVGLSWLIPIAVAGFVLLGESLSVVLAAHACVLVLLLLAPRLAGGRRAGDDDRRASPTDVAGDGAAGAAWTFAWPLVVAGCLSWLVHESDRFVLGYYHGAGAVGLYAAAYGLASAPFTAVAGAAAQVMQPVVFAASARAGRDGAPAASRPVLAGALLAGAGGVCVVWLSGDWIARLLLAEGYRSAAPELLVWIAAGYACFGAAMCLDLAAFGAKRTVFVMIACGVAAVTNVGLDLLLVPAHGAAGAAAATAAALCAYLLCMAGLVMPGARPGCGAAGGSMRPPRPGRAAGGGAHPAECES